MTRVPQLIADLGEVFFPIDPREKMTTTPRTEEYLYEADDPVFEAILEAGHNYGIASRGDLAVFDADELDELEDAIDALPETAWQVSGSRESKHFFLLVPGLDNDIPLYDPDTLENDDVDDRVIGHIKGASQSYVVGPSSTHPSGNKYGPLEGDEIVTMELDDLQDILEQYTKDSGRGDDDGCGCDNHHGGGGGGSGGDGEVGDEIDTFDVISNVQYSAGSRGEHPFHGSSTGSNFMVDEDGDTWRCWRHNCTGNALHLLGMDVGVISCGEWSGTGLSTDTWREIFKEARAAGYDLPDYDPDDSGNSHAALVPVERLENLSHDERRRYAKRQGVDWPDVDTVRDRLQSEILQAVEDGETTVIDSPTGSGKTYTSVTQEWNHMEDVTGGQPVVVAEPTCDARDQAAQDAIDALGRDRVKILKGRKELCPVAKGTYDDEFKVFGMKPSEYIDAMCDGVGVPFSVVHQWVSQEIGSLPCEEGDQKCPAQIQFEDVPRADDGTPSYDVVICTHQFLMVPGLRMQTNVFVDEKPQYDIDIGTEQAKTAVTQHLKWTDSPFENYHELVHASQTGTVPTEQTTISDSDTRIMKSADDEAVVAEIVRNSHPATVAPALDVEKLANYVWGKDEERDDLDLDEIGDLVDEATDYYLDTCIDADQLLRSSLDEKPPISWYQDRRDAHTLAPAIARAVLNAEPTAANRWHARVPYQPPRFDENAHDADGWNRIYVDVVLTDDFEIEDISVTPDFMLTRSLIGLDAYPQREDPWWQVSCHPNMETRRVLDTTERTLYRRFERGLFTVQVGENTQPVVSGNYLESQGRRMDYLTHALREEYGDEFSTGITSISAKGRLEEAMEESGVDEPQLMHYGEEESRNDFAGEQAGFVFGAHDLGDRHVLNIAARLGLNCDPEQTECPECEGDGAEDDGTTCERCTGNGTVRAVGRGFTGPDAHVAEAITEGWKEQRIGQSAGRWARHADDPDDFATVYIVTDSAPTGFVDAKVPGVQWMQTENQAKVLEHLNKQTHSQSAREIADAVDVPKRTVQRTLKKAEERDLLEKRAGAGKYGANLWATAKTPHSVGDVDVDAAGETKTPPYGDSYTWTVSIFADLRYGVGVTEGDRTALDTPPGEQSEVTAFADGYSPPG